MSLRFTPTSAQRRRHLEHRFFVQLALACLLGALPVLFLLQRHDATARQTMAANHLLEAELQALAPRLQAAKKAAADIASMQAHEQAAADMAVHRMEASQLLQALSGTSLPGIRLHAMALRQHRVLIHAYANDQQDISRFSEILSDTNLGHAALQDLRAKNSGSSDGNASQYDVTFSIDLPSHARSTGKAP